METIRCSQNKQILLVGDSTGKRTEYFGMAARIGNCSVMCVDWFKLREQDLALSTFIKLDPPGQSGVEIGALTSTASRYIKALEYLEEQKGLPFLNSPKAIRQTLDKKFCNMRLSGQGIESTEMVADGLADYEEFRSILESSHTANVFLKPRFGSGAAGVIAYRFHPPTGREIVYTSMCQEDDGKLYNTKRIFKINDRQAIRRMIDKLLQQPVIVEKWVQKAQFNGMSYDIRAVYQFGRLDFLVARGSKSPITNLHLNNCAIPADSIELVNSRREELEALCKKAADCFEGLNIAGIDVLVTPSGKLKIIEVNGQGDLIYQDIFNENRIYQRQVKEGMKRYGSNSNFGNARRSHRGEENGTTY